MSRNLFIMFLIACCPNAARAEDRVEVRTIKDAFEADIYALVFTKDGRTLVAGSQVFPEIKFFDVQTGKLKETIKGKWRRIFGLSFSPDEKPKLRRHAAY